MDKYICKRCCMEFSEKKGLVKHLKRKVTCLSIESEKTQDELLNEINKKDGLECENCKRKYKNDDSLRIHSHRCKGIVDNVREELEKRIDELQKELRGVINNKETINQVANTIDNSTTNNDNSTTNNINNTQNVTVIINDIDNPKSIQYILKDPNIVERIMGWVTDKNGLLKYLNEKYYNPERPENRGIRRLDKENMELHMFGRWIKYENKKALETIIKNLGIDWDTLITILKYDYWDDYEINKGELLVFNNDVGKPLDMELDITDDEEEKIESKEMIYIEDKHMYKDDVLVKKEKKWKEKILKNVK